MNTQSKSVSFVNPGKSVIQTKEKNIPKMRFPEFSGELQIYKLGNLTKWRSGGTPSKEEPSFWNGDIPWISASSMYGIRFSDSELKISTAAVEKGHKIVKKGTILLLVRGSMLFNKIPVGIVEKGVAFNQDVKAIEVENVLHNEYLLQWFLTQLAP